MDHFYIMFLRSVSLIENDYQPVGWRRDVASWLTQWSVDANFEASTYAEANGVWKALDHHRKAFIKLVDMHHGHWLANGRTHHDYGEDFEFSYTLRSLDLGGTFRVPQGSGEVHLKFSEIEAKNRSCDK